MAWSTYDANGLPLGSAPPGFKLLSITYIQQGTTSYTVPAWCRMVRVWCVGAGAQGGGVATAATNSGAGGGGGGGAISMKEIVTPKLTAFTVAVGAGGSTSGTGATTGQVGGDTTFDSPAVCTAKGGAGGIGDTIATIHVGGLGGAGGASASGVGDLKMDGGPGDVGLALAAAQGVSGNGGAGWLGQRHGTELWRRRLWGLRYFRWSGSRRRRGSERRHHR